MSGCVVWEGPSRFDGQPLVLLATNLEPTRLPNGKTGDAIQTWILRRDRDPYDANHDGTDASYCGSCALRPQGPDGAQRACYVHLGMVHNIWEAYSLPPEERGPHATIYPFLVELDEATPRRLGRGPFRDRKIRLGSFGDPAAVPFEVWEELVGRSAGWFGYTHAWRTCDQRFRSLLMASVDSPEERVEAEVAGWRTFRTRLPDEPIEPGEIVCPASAEAGHRTHCVDCGLCDGLHELRDPRRSIVIKIHGWSSAVSAYWKTRAALRVVA